jgi:uncharacterized protein (TIGR00369 family)
MPILPTHDLDEMWREPPRGRPSDISLLALPGVEVLRSYLGGGSTLAPLAPIARLTGRRLVAAEAGSVTFALPKSGWLVSGKGRLHPGVLAFLADAALTGAVQSALPARTVCTTAELSMTFCGPPPEQGAGALTAEARCIHVEEAMGLAEVFVRDSDGGLAAHGTSRTLVHPPIPEEVPLVAAEHAGEEPDADAIPDPAARPVTGAAGPLAGLEDMTGLEVLQSVSCGVLPRPPVDRLFGIRLVEAEDGRVAFELPAHGWLANEFGTVYGGMIAFLAKSAAAAAVQSVATRGTTYTALDMKVNFLRPVPPDGSGLTSVGTVAHRGRQLVIAGAEVTHQGRTIALATGTTALSGSAGAAGATE